MPAQPGSLPRSACLKTRIRNIPGAQFFGDAYVVEIFAGNLFDVPLCHGSVANRIRYGATGRSHPHANQAADSIRTRGPEHWHGSHGESERQLLHVVERIGEPAGCVAMFLAGNGILDPCYQRILGDEKQLACPVGGPWPANVVLLTLTQPLPSEPRKEISRADTAALGARTGQRPAAAGAHDGGDASGRRHAHQLRMSWRLSGRRRHRPQRTGVAACSSRARSRLRSSRWMWRWRGSERADPLNRVDHLAG